MYQTDLQITLAEFISPFGTLDQNNRWVRIADMIPWRRYEKRYAKQFCPDNGAPAIKFRMALGTLIIKQRTNHSDEEILQDILENPYMQYLIGLHEFTMKPPFAASSITNFRKYISKEMIEEINDEIFRNVKNTNDDDDNDGDDGKSDNNADDADTPINTDTTNNEDTIISGDTDVLIPNKGVMMLDATCAPANIAYQTDVNLLNEARKKLETFIDKLHPHTGESKKPRTYRRNARRDYLRFAKNRRPQIKTIRKSIKQQLQYVARDLRHIDKQLQTAGDYAIPACKREQLQTIRKLYAQQRSMYENDTHKVDDRIVSIDQPHVRPIVRGKTNASTEFGAKICVSLVDGYAFIDRLSWDAFNEESQLVSSIEQYKQRYGYYPKAVLADKIFRNRDNRAYCKKRVIRLSGPPLGRPPKEVDKTVLVQERKDASDRNAIEGKFGEGKLKYGLDRIMARLKGSSETVIAMSIFCMNISRRLRILLRYFYISFFQGSKKMSFFIWGF
jgi:hypothetical protein